jgi:hypothetical protein
MTVVADEKLEELLLLVRVRRAQREAAQVLERLNRLDKEFSLP